MIDRRSILRRGGWLCLSSVSGLSRGDTASSSFHGAQSACAEIPASVVMILAVTGSFVLVVVLAAGGGTVLYDLRCMATRFPVLIKRSPRPPLLLGVSFPRINCCVSRHWRDCLEQKRFSSGASICPLPPYFNLSLFLVMLRLPQHTLTTGRMPRRTSTTRRMPRQASIARRMPKRSCCGGLPLG